MPLTRTTLLLAAALIPAAADAQLPVQGCTQAENEVLAAYVPRMVQALLQGNMELYIRLANESNPKLSQNCQLAIMRQQQAQQINQQRARSGGGGSGGIIDHGNGAYSNGSVYCGPSGCMSLR